MELGLNNSGMEKQNLSILFNLQKFNDSIYNDMLHVTIRHVLFLDEHFFFLTFQVKACIVDSKKQTMDT